MRNPFVHVELATNDLGKAREFYQNLFDWKLEDMPTGDGDTYTMVEVGENDYGVGGGMMKAPMPGMPSNWMAYVSVDDIQAATEKAKSLGATVIKTSRPCPGWVRSVSSAIRPARCSAYGSPIARSEVCEHGFERVSSSTINGLLLRK
jgi:predicted enzyme related to lactoylglutathione lyase